MNKIFLLLILGLIGCSQGKSLLSSENIIESDWALRPDPYKPKALFCYKSMAKPDCYDHRIENNDHRLIANYSENQFLFDRDSAWEEAEYDQ